MLFKLSLNGTVDSTTFNILYHHLKMDPSHTGLETSQQLPIRRGKCDCMEDTNFSALTLHLPLTPEAAVKLEKMKVGHLPSKGKLWITTATNTFHTAQLSF